MNRRLKDGTVVKLLDGTQGIILNEDEQTSDVYDYVLTHGGWFNLYKDDYKVVGELKTVKILIEGKNLPQNKNNISLKGEVVPVVNIWSEGTKVTIDVDLSKFGMSTIYQLNEGEYKMIITKVGE